METSPRTEIANSIGAPFHSWLERVDQQTLVLALVFVVAMVLLRGPLASALGRVVRWVLSSLSITLSDEIEEEIDRFLRILLVAGSLLLALDAVSPPEIAGGFVRRILISILVLALFAAWYRLMEPMVGLIGPDKLADVRLDTSWMVRLGQFAVVLMSITALLSVWEIDISSALTGVGVLGAGLAIASQDFVRNLVAGMNNMSEKRFETGDWIAVDGVVEGTVTRVDVRSTTIMGFDHVPHYVPNSELSNAIVLNKSRMDHRRIIWTIPLVFDATDAQVDAVVATLSTYLEESGDFVTDGSCPRVVCPFGLSDSAIEIRVLTFTRTKDYQPYLEVSGRLVSAIRRAIREAGTDLAYPTQTLFVTPADAAETAARRRSDPSERPVEDSE